MASADFEIGLRKNVGGFDVSVIEIGKLKGHEMVDGRRLEDLRKQIEADGILKKPIVADKQTNVILDGHHRTAALLSLGCLKIPVCYVDYDDDHIGLRTDAVGIEITKPMVIEAALRGEPFPPKSTWHYLSICNGTEHISCIQRRVDIPLQNLR